jgi:muconolactone delta-isomerase
MEFLTNIEINWPVDGDPAEKERLFAAELERGQELSRQGFQRRLWRVPGRWANWGLWECKDATELHEKAVLAAALPVDGHHGLPTSRARERSPQARYRS